jgi:5'-nucleotidase
MSQFEKPTVLIDMDGVLADFDQEVINRLMIRYPHIPILKQRQNFYISDDYPEHSLLLREISDEQGFFSSLPLMENALHGWQRIIDLGYHPMICSAPMKSNPYSKSEKLEWLTNYFVPTFGQYVVDQAIITSDKHLHEGVVLIDDRPIMYGADEASWKHIIFDHPYNRSSLEQPRQYGWLDDNLPNLLKAA